jgi:hypothetical protein
VLGAGLLGLRRRTGRDATERDEQILPLNARIRLAYLLKIQHDPRAIAHLDQADAAQIALVDDLRVPAQRILDAREIECDTRRVGHAEARRHGGQRLCGRQFQDDVAALLAYTQGLNGILCPCRLRQQHAQREKQSSNDGFGCIHFLPSGCCFSCNCNVLVRSI